MNKDKRYRDRMNSKGLYEVRGIWAPKGKHNEIKRNVCANNATWSGIVAYYLGPPPDLVELEPSNATTSLENETGALTHQVLWCDFYPNKEEQ